MIEPYALSGLLNGILALSVGVFVIAKNWREHGNRLFFLMTSATAFWGLAYWRWLSSASPTEALFWVRMLSVGSILIPAFYFHWITSFLGIEKRYRAFLFAAYAGTSALLLFSFSGLFISGLKPELSFPFWPKPGPLYLPYLILMYLGLVGYGVALAFLAYRNSAGGAKKGQLFYIILGTIIGFGGGATNFFLWYGISIPPYGNILVALFPFLLGYAILKHQLFDVRVIVTEILVFAMSLFMLIRALAADTPLDRIIEFILLGVISFFGAFLIRSVEAEIKSRERIASLADELKTANEELKKLDAAKSEFISIASHQLRAPLTVIRGYASLILENSFGEISSKVVDALKKIEFSSNQLVKLIADLLDLSRIEAGRMKYNFNALALNDVAKEVFEEFREQAKAKELSFTYAESDVPLTVRADPDKLREVVMNLVDNAIKYTSAGRVAIRLAKRIGQSNLEFMRLEVQDSGIGIAPEDKPRLFTKFARSEEARRIRADGMGLGLYVIKKIVEDHGGRCWAESAGLGKGSAFFVELPLINPPKNQWNASLQATRFAKK